MDVQAGQVYASLADITFGQVDAFGVDWSLESLDGWGATASTIDVVQRPRQNGGWAGTAHAVPRSLALSGKFFAPTPEAARVALDRLNNACSVDDSLLTVVEPGLSRSLLVRRSDAVIHRWVMPQICEWSIQVVALDPRKLGATQTASTRLPSTTGGLTIPYTIPYSINAVQVSGQVTLTNTGNTAGPVRARIDGPCVGPVVTHGSQVLSLPLLTLSAGEWLDVDFEKRQVLANGQASRNSLIGSRGWADFTPGPNTYSFTAASYTAGAQLTITAVSADK